MAPLSDWAALLIVGGVFLVIVWQLVKGWRRATRPSACPMGKCGASSVTESPSAIPDILMQGSPEVPEEVVDAISCPHGGCAFTDSLYSGASECGPSCTCARCRDSIRGGKLGVRPCTSLIEVDEGLRSSDAVILFWASGCGPCAAFKPTYAAVAARVGTPMYAVDYAEVPEVVDKFQLKGFPTVLRFRQGAWHSEYTGDRSEADFLAWVTR